MREPDERDGRRRRAARSRRRIVEAATAHFVAHGYASTTIEHIARDAGVAPQTVYYDFGSKSNVLAAALDAAIVGDDDAVPVIGRPWAEEVGRLADGGAAVEHLVRSSVAILARVAPVYGVLLHAATDPDVHRLHVTVRDRRRRDQRTLVDALAGSGHLRSGLTVEDAADVVYALVNEEVFLMLVGDCAWDVERFSAWLASTMRDQLLTR